jgi:hypothetical protein
MLKSTLAPFRILFSCLRNRSAVELLLVSCGLIIPLYFVLRTQLVWEDFLITYRYSENLARGNGLVYSPGEHVHGFTSPVNVLLPALFCWLTRAKDFLVPLLFYRVFALAGLILAMVSFTSALKSDAGSSWSQRLLAALFPLFSALEVKTTAFTMSGQETGYMIGFLAPAFALCYMGQADFVALGICFTGVLYTRPDGCIYIAAVALSSLAFGPIARRTQVGLFVKAGVLAALLYLPWIVFATAYFGSPVPHTVVAKNGTEYFPSDSLSLFAPVAAGLAQLPARICSVFAPIYDFQNSSGPDAWPKWIHDLTFFLVLVAVLYWLLPTRDRSGRMASLCAFLILAYLTYASLIATSCPWYYAPLAFLTIFTLLRIAGTLARSAHPAALGGFSAGALAAVLGLFLGFLFFSSLPGLALKQSVVDGGNRRDVGLWLRANVAPTESVYLEPLGYIGYYSGCKMLDWPGLVAPEVVAARRSIGKVPQYPWGAFLWGKAAEVLKPDWIVARPTEVAQLNYSPYLSQHYHLVHVFNVADQILAAGIFHGRNVCYGEAVFEVFRRNGR